MSNNINSIKEEALQEITKAETLNQLEAARIKFLGRKGKVSGLLEKMKKLIPDEKPLFGKQVNSLKVSIQAGIAEAKKSLEQKGERLCSSADKIDITLPGLKRKLGTVHPITQTIEDVVAIFRDMGFSFADGPDIETEFNNFDALNTPADHPSRDIQDTFYLENGSLLRTQTSPVQIRVMMSKKPPIQIIAPGRVYRNDTPDATHGHTFHQIEGLYVDKNVSFSDLKGVLHSCARQLMGKDVKIRFRPHFFPFTEPSVEYDFSCVMCRGKGCKICKNSGWIEISGAGMVDPRVYEKVGYDPEKYSGYAFGLGIERIAMIKYGIDDLRLFYENDERFLNQFA